MTNGKNMSPAQMVDSFLRRVALGVAIVGTAYGLSALEQLLPEREAGYADMVQFGLSILVIVLVLPAFAKFMLARKRGVCKSAEADSYMAEMFKHAAHHGFTAAFISLITLEMVAKKFTTGLEAGFFLDVALFATLSTFALSFHRLTRDEDEEDDREGDVKDLGDE